MTWIRMCLMHLLLPVIRFLGRSMATKVDDKEEGSTKVPKNLDNWKFPKIPVCKIYKKNPFRIFPSYAIKDFQQTVTLTSSDDLKTYDLLSEDCLRGFAKKRYKFVHFGLVQVAIKPLIRNGLEAPVIVFLRDARHHDFQNSLLAAVVTNMSQGPFYFNCFPSFSVSATDWFTFEGLPLTVNTTGIPLVLTIRIVFKAMVDLRAEYLAEPMFGRTTYFHATSGAEAVTYWSELKIKGSNSSTETAQASRAV